MLLKSSRTTSVSLNLVTFKHSHPAWLHECSGQLAVPSLKHWLFTPAMTPLTFLLPLSTSPLSPSPAFLLMPDAYMSHFLKAWSWADFSLYFFFLMQRMYDLIHSGNCLLLQTWKAAKFSLHSSLGWQPRYWATYLAPLLAVSQGLQIVYVPSLISECLRPNQYLP